MFSLIEDKKRIAQAQTRLEATIRRDFRKKETRNIGYPGGTIFDAEIITNGSYWFWSADAKGKNAANPRRLNFFGLYPEKGGLQISVEINTTFEGRNDQVAGFFARDNSTGAVYLLHSGRVGGGTAGVGKTAFLAWSNRRPVDVTDSNGDIRQGIVVMPIDGKGAVTSAMRYVATIAAFKHAARDGSLAAPEFQKRVQEYKDVFPEPRGRRRGTRSGEFDYLSRHGDVVDALAGWRTSAGLAPRARVVKTILMDLGVTVGRKLTEVYEVKTSTNRSDVYTAIGQLMVHGNNAACRRVIVLPHGDAIAPDLREALQRMDIELLWFKLTETAAAIVRR